MGYLEMCHEQASRMDDDRLRDAEWLQTHTPGMPADPVWLAAIRTELRERGLKK